MKFKNNNHQALFNNEAKRMNRHDNVKMAVLYLLTADFRLWNEAKRHIRRGNIDLDSIKVRNGNLKAYIIAIMIIIIDKYIILCCNRENYSNGGK